MERAHGLMDNSFIFKERVLGDSEKEEVMVCDRCEKKLSTLITPDTWKDGSRNAKTGKMGRKVNVNMLSSKFGKNKRYVVALFFFSRPNSYIPLIRFTPMSRICKICKVQVHQWANYCSNCAFAKGICARCGRKVSSSKHHVRRDANVRDKEKLNGTIEAEVTESTNDHLDDDGDSDENEVVQEKSATHAIETKEEWRKLTDARGNTYYYNPKTNKTSWTIPKKGEEEEENTSATSNWKEAMDDYGRKYYYNTKTNETSWTLPDVSTTTTQQKEFIPSQKFTVARQGYYFAMGRFGLGYYLDK